MGSKPAPPYANTVRTPFMDACTGAAKYSGQKISAVYNAGNTVFVFTSLFEFEPAMNTDVFSASCAVEWYRRGISNAPRPAGLHGSPAACHGLRTRAFRGSSETILVVVALNGARTLAFLRGVEDDAATF